MEHVHGVIAWPSREDKFLGWVAGTWMVTWVITHVAQGCIPKVPTIFESLLNVHLVAILPGLRVCTQVNSYTSRSNGNLMGRCYDVQRPNQI